MENRTNSSVAASTADTKATAPKNGAVASTESSQLMQLFVIELKTLYCAEGQLNTALPKLTKAASSSELIAALGSHLEEVTAHEARLLQLFEITGKKVKSKKCKPMQFVLAEANNWIDSCSKGALCDAGLIVMLQKAHHYRIASYGSLTAFSRTFNGKEATAILQKSLDEVKRADERLSTIAKNINAKASKKVAVDEGGTENNT